MFRLGLGWLCLWLPVARAADKIPALAAISSELSAQQQQDFVQRKQTLEAELAGFKAAAEAFNAKSAENQSDAEFDKVQARRTRYVTAAKEFNEDMDAAVEGARMIKKLNALARKLGWSGEKLDRLDLALNKLDSDGDPSVTRSQIKDAWATILSRDSTGELAREAAQADGLGFAGAGTQTVNQDCTIFALANATGLPYGVVAARATKLMQEGEWRPPGERADPEKVIARQGLAGGEVVMLAEAFGQAKVVPMTEFAQRLAEGRPVLVAVVPQDGDVRFGHEVVLTKTFQHNGETWYAMMDSNQGPQRRLFLSARELGTVFKENGVVFSPESKTTPQLLR
jgi:hypothetical protein